MGEKGGGEGGREGGGVLSATLLGGEGQALGMRYTTEQAKYLGYQNVWYTRDPFS